MAKYTKSDLDVKEFDDDDKASYERFLLDYNVDEDAETAKGAESTKAVWDMATKGSSPVSLSEPSRLYLALYTIIVGLATTFVMILIVTLIILIFVYIIKKDEVSKLYIKIIIMMLIFVLGMILLIVIFMKLKDSVQKNLEKILFKL